MARSDKISPGAFNAWCRACSRAPPTSQLWLLRTCERQEGNLRAAWSASGLDQDRLKFCPVLPTLDHVRRLSLSHVFLDTDAYNSHTLACDALWCNVPVLTLRTYKWAGRVGHSLMSAVGCPECSVQAQGEYEDMMVRLAEDRKVSEGGCRLEAIVSVCPFLTSCYSLVFRLVSLSFTTASGRRWRETRWRCLTRRNGSRSWRRSF